MQEFPSRSERRSIRFQLRAEKGLFNSEEILYISEAKKLLSNGFSVVKVTDAELKRGVGFYLVSWESPYGTCIPYEVEEYVKGNSGYPYEHIKTNAQSLYVISAKALLNK